MNICPCCGRCKECGQPAQAQPYYPQPQTWPYPPAYTNTPNITWGGSGIATLGGKLVTGGIQ